MKNLRKIAVSAIIAAVWIMSIAAPQASALSISAKSAVVIDSATRAVLYEKNAYERLPMASTTKIMTAYLALKYGGLDDVVTVSKHAASVGGSSMYLTEGEQLTLLDLLYGLMLNSGNDAATAIAEHVGGSEEEFVRLMNQTAKSLGLENTGYVDPYGYYHEEHATTAYELAVLTAHVFEEEPLFSEIIVTKSRTAGTYPNGSPRVLSNHNKLLGMYEYADGVKTGFTTPAGRCLVSSATKDGARIIAVTLNDPDDWNDHKEMLEYGFGQFTQLTLVGAGEKEFKIQVGGGESQVVSAVNREELSLRVPSSLADSVTLQTRLEPILFAPVSAGQKLGVIWAMSGDEILGEIELIADTTVPEREYSAEAAQSKSLIARVMDGVVGLIRAIMGLFG